MKATEEFERVGQLIDQGRENVVVCKGRHCYAIEYGGVKCNSSHLFALEKGSRAEAVHLCA